MTGLTDLLTPLLLAALGGLWSERAGVLNIALEGQLQTGAFTAAVIFLFTGNPVLAALGAGMVGLLFSLVLAWGHLKLKADLFITGLALNLLLPALAAWVSQGLFGNQGVIRSTQSSGVAVSFGLPGWGSIFDGHSAFFWVAGVFTAGTAFVLARTRFGLRLRTSGSKEELLASRGLSVGFYRTSALGLSGTLAALGGAALTLHLGAYVPGMSAGQGWMALAAVYLGFRRAGGVLAACLVLAASQLAAHSVQRFVDLPSGVFLALPPLITCVVFVVGSALRRRRR